MPVQTRASKRLQQPSLREEGPAGNRTAQDNDTGAAAEEKEEEKQLSGAQKVRTIYANVRGLRQAAGELRSMVSLQRPHLIVLTETHLNGDSVEAEMLPVGYKVAARFDRTIHGGGVLILVQDQLLVDTVQCGSWCKKKVAEIIAVETREWVVIGGYTQGHLTAPQLFEALERMRASDRFQGKKMIIMVDANSHHTE